MFVSLLRVFVDFFVGQKAWGVLNDLHPLGASMLGDRTNVSFTDNHLHSFATGMLEDVRTAMEERLGNLPASLHRANYYAYLDCLEARDSSPSADASHVSTSTGTFFILGRSSQADCLSRNTAMDDSIGGS